MTTPPFIAAMVIPTGIGASIGGFGGDAAMAMNLLASCCDTLITHPNVANAAAFQNLPKNTLYVEGYGLDQFFKGQWLLNPVRQNKIGVVFDKAIEPRMLTLHLNTINAVKSIYQTNVINHVLTKEVMDITCTVEESGASSGSLKNPEILLDACQQLIEQGATALAICLKMPELDEEAEKLYRLGNGADPIGGLEAIASHLVVEHFNLPCAHVPVFNEADVAPEMETVLDPRVAPEFIISTFLPCVLMGLKQAPQFINKQANTQKPPYAIDIKDLSALVVPADCLGSIPVLKCVEQDITMITVAENTTAMDAKLATLEISNTNILQASTYYEAAGLLQGLRNGLI